MKVFIAFCLIGVALVHSQNFGRQNFRSSGNRNFRKGRQFNTQPPIPTGGGIDFSGCQNDIETGLCCIEKDETVSSIQKDPLLECTHKNVEKCHYTYITQFSPSQEEVCDENFEKSCQITFKQQAFNETIKKCYKPLEKVCNGQGPEECRTLYESSCTTKYVEKQPGKFVGDTSCEKLPIEICGAGCTTEEGPEECHDKTVTSLVDIPEEICDLNPQKTCRFQTKLVPRLKPAHECTTIPQETCNLKFTQPRKVDKPLKTKWCLDDTPPVPGETYDENNALGAPIGSFSQNSNSFAQPDNSVGSQQQSSSSSSSFGPQQQSSSFGGSSSSSFGPQQSSSFGSQSSSGGLQQVSSFGQQGSSFGGSQQGSSFGGSQQGSSFGGSQQGSSFGGSQQGSSFGGSQQGSSIGGSQQGSTFGGSQQGSSLGGSSFGGSQQASSFGGSSFGGSQQGSSFDGSQQTSSFGGSEQQSSSSFGGPSSQSFSNQGFQSSGSSSQNNLDSYGSI
nr:oleosin-B4-like isoform X2 [Lepeophtheirus salmonis]XP_040570548.1 oleosin-B4-like isoform X2 [Lepeophtheirus salmonis]